jgi:cellobiose epimerase
MADNNEPKSMNTHLHVLEAYSELVRVTQNEAARRRLAELLCIFLDRIIRPSGHLGIFFDSSFIETPASQAICSFGHEIEASWLLLEAAEALEDEILLERTRAACVKMLQGVVRVGMDWDGGLFLESYRHGSHVRTNKHWWIQAETLVGLMNGYQITGDEVYWEHLKRSWQFIQDHVVDHQCGEWFTKVSRLGEPFLMEPVDDPSPYYRNDWKIDPWKCPYHNGRACLELIRRIDQQQ